MVVPRALLSTLTITELERTTHDIRIIVEKGSDNQIRFLFSVSWYFVALQLRRRKRELTEACQRDLTAACCEKNIIRHALFLRGVPKHFPKTLHHKP